MRSLLVTLGIITLLGLSTQFVRHLYVGWVMPRTSALDSYRDQAEKDIDATESFENLVKKYEAAHKEYEKRRAEDKGKEKEEGRDYWNEEQKYRRAIEVRESANREVLELHFFWWCGFGFVVSGLLFRPLERWFAIGCLLVGFVEMIYWTSPTFRFIGGGSEFERLLFWKLVYTAASLALLLILWFLFSSQAKREAVQHQTG